MKTENKEQTPLQKRQRQKLLVYPLIGSAFLLAMYFIFAPETQKNKVDDVQGFNADLPLPQDKNLIGDKKTAYEQEQQKRVQRERMRSLQDYAFILGKDSISDSKELDLQISEKEIQANVPGNDKLPYRAVRSSGVAYKNMTRELTNFYEPSRENEDTKRLKAEIESLKKKLEQAEATSQTVKQLELMEKSYQMASKYLTTPTGEVSSQLDKRAENSGKNIDREKHTTLTAVSGIPENVVSRLPQEISDSAFMRDYVRERNIDFHTPVKPAGQTDRNTIRACVYQQQVLEFGNDEKPKVRLRLLEPIKAGILLIPRNSIIAGDVTLQGGRLHIKITSLEYAGNILPVELEIYDLEGQKGIDAAGTMETEALKEAAGNMGNDLGTSITFTQNAGQQVAADLAKTAIQTGAQYLSKKIKTVKITLKPGHEVFILLPGKQ